jgi:LysM repeat protein
MAMTFKSDDGDETYEDYDAYAALNRQSLLRKPYMPYIAAGVVALVVIIGFAMYGTSSQSDALTEEVALLGKRLDDLEFRIGNLEQAASGGEGLGALQQQSETLARQIQNLESKLGESLNQVDSKLAALEKRQQSLAKSAAPAPPSKAKANAPRTHVVKAGETLYQISRKYGVTVEELKKRNKMGQDVTIRPGQELVVGN